MRKPTHAAIKARIRRSGLVVFVTRIGTGRNVQIGIHGPDAIAVSAALDHMLTRTPMSGQGTGPNDLIVMDTDLQTNNTQ